MSGPKVVSFITRKIYMKLKSLGILLLLLLLGVTSLSIGVLLYQHEQFAQQRANTQDIFAEIIVPLRQIDANTKNLRFHLYASFMHDPEQSVSPLHTHPLSAHTDTVRNEMQKNSVLWNSVTTAARSANLGYVIELKTMYDSYFEKGVQPGVVAAEQSNWTGIVRTVTGSLPEYIEFEKSLQEKINRLQKANEQSYKEFTAIQNNLILMLVCLFGLVLFVAAIFVHRTVKSYSMRLALAMRGAEAIATGNLSQNLDFDGSCEASGVLRAMSAMQNSMRQLVGTIRSSSDSIHGAATEVAAGNIDFSNRTERQAASLEETATSMQELTSTVEQNANNASSASKLAEAASSVASDGGLVVSKVVSTMESINQSAKKIVDIIAVIDGIAFQTNILALNAAVEAARAGEQGRGFAVVASEVRNLAQRSAGAAKEIKALIGDSVEKIEQGTVLVAKAGTTMDEVVASVQRVTTIMIEIANASHEQTMGISQISRAIVDMDGVVQQNAALVEQASAATMSLQDQASGLAAAVKVFKLGNDARVPINTPASGIQRPSALQLTVKATKPSATGRAVLRRDQASSPVTEDEWQSY
jgi:methyl-accepting chemotaxis protein